jgi:hypothetical protein
VVLSWARTCSGGRAGFARAGSFILEEGGTLSDPGRLFSAERKSSDHRTAWSAHKEARKVGVGFWRKWWRRRLLTAARRRGHLHAAHPLRPDRLIAVEPTEGEVVLLRLAAAVSGQYQDLLRRVASQTFTVGDQQRSVRQREPEVIDLVEKYRIVAHQLCGRAAVIGERQAYAAGLARRRSQGEEQGRREAAPKPPRALCKAKEHDA